MKITKYFLSMAAAIGMIAGCQKPEMVQIAAPEDVVAPVLEAVEGPIEITPSNMVDGKVTFTWSAADYGVATQVNYSLLAATAAAPEAKVSITSGLTVTEVEVAYETLNAILFNDLKLNDGIAEDVVFTISAKLGEYAPVYSNAITVSCKVTAAEKQYPKLYVVGSYNGWSHDKNQYIFDFAGTDAVYQGMVDFGEDHAANEFKITGGAWGNDEHSMDGAHDPESKTIAVTDGGGDNINVYQAKRYYHLTYDRAAHTLTADFSFDQIGVIGDFNSWGADVVMSFNETKQRFYADVEFPADGGFKFRADGGWDVNWGVKDGVLELNADNIAVTAGNYRVYVNMNNLGEMTYELNAGMYGKDEPVGGTTTPEPEPEPTPVVGWGLVGEYNGWGAEPDVMLASDGTFLVAKGVALSGQVKFRKDGAWDTNFGAPGEVEPVEIAVNTELELVAGGKNFTIAEGTYDVYLDETNAKAWFINDGSYPGGEVAPVEAEWGLIGSLAACNNWSNNVKLYVAGDYSVAKGVVFASGDQFKFRKGEAWGVELTYEGAITIDAKLDLIDGTGGKQNSSIAEGGTYDVFLANDLSAFYVMTPGKTPADAGAAPEPTPEPEPVVGWGIVGEYNNWGAEPDVMLASDGTYLAAKGVALSGQVKFRKDGAWDTNFGAPGEVEPVEIAVNTELELVAGGKNFTIAEGTYDVYLDEANAKAWFITDGSYPGGNVDPVEAEWGLIGSLAACNNWSKNVKFYVDGDYSVAKGVVFAAGDQFKFRKGEAWGVELTYEGAITIDAKLDLIDGTGGKQNSSIAEGGTYDVFLANDLSAFYVMTPGKTPADAGQAQKQYTDPSAESFVVGFSGSAIGWDDPSFDTNDRAAFVSKNVTDAKTYAGTYEFKLDSLTFAAGDEFKVRINGQWIGVGGAVVEGLAVSGSDNFVAGDAGTYAAVISFAWDGSTHSDVKVVFSK